MFRWSNKRKGLRSIAIMLMSSMLIGSLSGCQGTQAGKNRESYHPDQVKADTTMQSIIDALEAHDREALKALFSSYAIEHIDDLDERLEELMAFYPGGSESFEGTYNTYESFNYGDHTKVLNGVYKVPCDNEIYDINFTLYLTNDEETEKKGIYLIEMIKENEKPEGFKRKDETDAPGVYIQE